MKKLILGITGASGSIYAKALIEILQKTEIELHLIITDNGRAVFKYELELDFDEFIKPLKNIFVYKNYDMFAPVASGSFKVDAMVILPCSMAEVAKISQGIGDTLLCRAADVTLKERRKLIICPRETPFNRIHLKNMLKLTDAGGIVFPMFPAFYAKPESINQIVNISVERMLNTLEISTENYFEWGISN